MQKISAFFLLLAAFIPFAFIVFLQVKQQVIRYHVKERMEQQLLQTISISETEVQWVKTGKEILVDGKMFDVKSFYTENGETNFTGLFDDEETALVKQLEENTKKNNEDGSGLLTDLLDLLQSVYPDKNTFQVIICGEKSNNFSYININIKSPYKTVTTPPPQC